MKEKPKLSKAISFENDQQKKALKEAFRKICADLNCPHQQSHIEEAMKMHDEIKEGLEGTDVPTSLHMVIQNCGALSYLSGIHRTSLNQNCFIKTAIAVFSRI